MMVCNYLVTVISVLTIIMIIVYLRQRIIVLRLMKRQKNALSRLDKILDRMKE